MHILSLSESHNSLASLQGNRADESRWPRGSVAAERSRLQLRHIESGDNGDIAPIGAISRVVFSQVLAIAIFNRHPVKTLRFFK